MTNEQMEASLLKEIHILVLLCLMVVGYIDYGRRLQLQPHIYTACLIKTSFCLIIHVQVVRWLLQLLGYLGPFLKPILTFSKMRSKIGEPP